MFMHSTIADKLQAAIEIDKANGVDSRSITSEHYRVYWNWIRDTDPKAVAPGDHLPMTTRMT